MLPHAYTHAQNKTCSHLLSFSPRAHTGRVRVLHWGSRGGSCGRWLGRLGLLCVATVALAPPELCRQPGSCELLQLLSL